MNHGRMQKVARQQDEADADQDDGALQYKIPDGSCNDICLGALRRTVGGLHRPRDGAAVVAAGARPLHQPRALRRPVGAHPTEFCHGRGCRLWCPGSWPPLKRGRMRRSCTRIPGRTAACGRAAADPSTPALPSDRWSRPAVTCRAPRSGLCHAAVPGRTGPLFSNLSGRNV